jgi:hypothetical protein
MQLKPRSTAQHQFERALGGVGDRLRRSGRFSRGSSLKGALGQGSWRSSLISAYRGRLRLRRSAGTRSGGSKGGSAQVGERLSGSVGRAGIPDPLAVVRPDASPPRPAGRPVGEPTTKRCIAQTPSASFSLGGIAATSIPWRTGSRWHEQERAVRGRNVYRRP